MESETQLECLIVYDEAKNEYTICNHNLNQQQTTDLMNEWQAHLRPGCAFIQINQNKRHKTADAQDCHTCRNDVRRVLGSRLNKVPEFARRKK